jgi:2-aminoethylphosphonate-pyruvate transaminase
MNNGKNSLYLDLANYLHHQDQGGTPFTQSIQVMYALDEALSEHAEEGGWRSRQQSYRNKMNVLLEGLTSMGIKPYLDPKESSCVLQSFNLPEGIGYKAFHDKLKQQGFVIYSGQGKLAEAIFRVSLMGVITEEDTQRFVEAVRKVTTD